MAMNWLGTFLTGGAGKNVIQTVDPNVDMASIGIFNVARYGMNPTAAPAANRLALLQAVQDALSVGGKVYVPGALKFYHTSGAPIVISSGQPIQLVGDGAGSVITKDDGGDLFQFENYSGSPSGATISDLVLRYTNVESGGGNAIYAAGAQLVIAERVWFLNCPSAYFMDNRSLQCGMDKCTVENTKQNNSIQIVLNGPQNFLRQTVMRQQPIGSGGPTGTTAVQLLGNASTLDAVQMSDFNVGLAIGQGAFRNYISKIFSEAWTTALLIMPAGNSGQIFKIYIAQCDFAQTNNSNVTTAGVIVDPNGGPDTNLEEIEFTACTSDGWIGPGWQLNGGKIKLIGGAGRGNGGGGFLAAGGFAKLRGFDALGAQVGASATQPYGLMASGAGAIDAAACDLRGNLTGALHNTSSGSVLLDNCPGYTDQNLAVDLTGSPPASGSAFKASQFGYFGKKAVFEIAGGTVTAIKRGPNPSTLKATGRTLGDLVLGENEYGELEYSVAPTTLFFVGH